jgi:hypothetical protein
VRALIGALVTVNLISGHIPIEILREIAIESECRSGDVFADLETWRYLIVGLYVSQPPTKSRLIDATSSERCVPNTAKHIHRYEGVLCYIFPIDLYILIDMPRFVQIYSCPSKVAKNLAGIFKFPQYIIHLVHQVSWQRWACRNGEDVDVNYLCRRVPVIPQCYLYPAFYAIIIPNEILVISQCDGYDWSSSCVKYLNAQSICCLSSLGTSLRGVRRASGDTELGLHNPRLSSVDTNLSDNRTKLENADGDKQPISKLHFRIAGLIGIVAAYWIAFCGAWFEWRPKWRGTALIAFGGIVFCCSLGAIELTAYYP